MINTYNKNSMTQQNNRNNRQVVTVLAIMLFIILTIINTSTYNATLRHTFFPMVLFVIGMIFDNVKVSLKKAHLYCFGIILIATISTIYSDAVSLSLVYRSLIIFISFFIIATSVNYNHLSIRRIVRMYLLVSFGVALFVVFNAATNGFEPGVRYSLVVMGVRTDSNYMTAFIMPGFALALIHFINSKKYRIVFILISVTIALAVLFSGSRAAFVTLCFVFGSTVIVYLREKKAPLKKIIVFTLILLVTIGLYYFLMTRDSFGRVTDLESYRDNIRLEIWSVSLDLFLENKLIGSGIGASANYTLRNIGAYTHNNFIVILAEQGLLGALVFLLLIKNMINNSAKNKEYFIIVLLSFFIPLYFIDGYPTATFWLPITFCQIISDFSKTNSNKLYNFY